MNKILKSTLAACLGMVCLSSVTSCIDETEPTSTATEEQVKESSTALQASLMGIHAKLNQMNESLVDDNNWHAPFGYPAMMIIRDLLTGDQGFNSTSYTSHFTWTSRNKYLGDGYLYMQYVWNYYYGIVLSANKVIGAVDETTATDLQKGYLGAGLAFRAMTYLDMARMYEFLPNDKTDAVNDAGNNVLNLTVPIVTENTTEDGARNNPRVSRTDMAAFILADLDKAESLIDNMPGDAAHILPDLSCVYGLKARLYMWIEDYPNAEKYAHLAIDNARVEPLDESEALGLATGYNTSSDFMWGCNLTKEDGSVQSGIVNHISWISNQTTFGYTGPATGVYMICDKNFYDRIGNTDWRKLQWQCPKGSPLASSISYIDAFYGSKMPAYASLKFRPAAGDMNNYSVGAAAGYPLMRVEEMYFIEAEAAAHQDAARGKALVEDFMKNYRDAAYTCSETETDKVVEEIVFQKRVELWGEGQTFFDIKRLNYSVIRGYHGTPFFSTARFNTNGRPAWMNCVIVRTEGNNNSALKDWNNPDPSDAYEPWSE